MARAKRIVRQMTVAEYLEFEEKSQSKHEYFQGQVFSMAGGTEAHHVICGNLFSKLHQFLEGSGCRAFMAEMKVHAKEANCFYYPDVMVTCEKFEANSVFKSKPILIAEVLSTSTQQIDRREKRVAYQQIESLQQYVIIHQRRMQIDLYNRISDTQWEMLTLLKTGELELRACPQKLLKLAIEDVYRGVDFTPLVKEFEEEEYSFELI